MSTAELSLLDIPCVELSESDKEAIVFIVTRLLGLKDCMRTYLKIYVDACQVRARESQRYNQSGAYILNFLMGEAESIQQQLESGNLLNRKSISAYLEGGGFQELCRSLPLYEKEK